MQSSRIYILRHRHTIFFPSKLHSRSFDCICEWLYWCNHYVYVNVYVYVSTCTRNISTCTMGTRKRTHAVARQTANSRGFTHEVHACTCAVWTQLKTQAGMHSHTWHARDRKYQHTRTRMQRENHHTKPPTNAVTGKSTRHALTLGIRVTLTCHAGHYTSYTTIMPHGKNCGITHFGLTHLAFASNENKVTEILTMYLLLQSMSKQSFETFLSDFLGADGFYIQLASSLLPAFLGRISPCTNPAA